MATYDVELLGAARQLLSRTAGQRGRLPSARIRRSISSVYYALFHFLLGEAGRVLVGSAGTLHRRRRTLARSFSHSGMKTALDKIRGASVDPSVTDLLRPPGVTGGPVTAPAFAREIGTVFSDAQAKRVNADYDLNRSFSELDAIVLLDRVEKAIEAWRAANTPADQDFKESICMLMLLRGQLKRES